jgi:hypothetical protein
MGIFWRAFKECFDSDFEDAVSYLIANSLKAPLLEALSKQIEFAKLSRIRGHQTRAADLPSIMQRAQESNEVADPEFVKACMKIFKEKITCQLNSTQFKQGCDLLEQTAQRKR